MMQFTMPKQQKVWMHNSRYLIICLYYLMYVQMYFFNCDQAAYGLLNCCGAKTKRLSLTCVH
jgi:hypothetical protein